MDPEVTPGFNFVTFLTCLEPAQSVQRHALNSRRSHTWVWEYSNLLIHLITETPSAELIVDSYSSTDSTVLCPSGYPEYTGTRQEQGCISPVHNRPSNCVNTELHYGFSFASTHLKLQSCQHQKQEKVLSPTSNMGRLAEVIVVSNVHKPRKSYLDCG